jgi:two-component system KDP operon response regulator KdpE
MARILVAGPVEQQRGDLRIGLESQGHAVAEAATAEHAIEEAKSGFHDVLIVDAGMDSIDLYGFCRAIRAHSDLGIIALLREGASQCRIDALNAGADDYHPQRFVLAELLARIRAIMRRIRAFGEAKAPIALQDRAIDLCSRKIQGPGNRVTALTPKEFLVLKFLIDSTDKPVTHLDLARAAWEGRETGDFEYVRIVVSQLRRKLERDYTRPQYILTERSIGYRFTMPRAAEQPPARETPSYQYRTDSRAMAL